MQQLDTFKVTTVATLVSAYFSNNHVAVSEVPGIIALFGQEVENLLNPTPVEVEAPKPEPAVAIKKSVTPDYIVSLFDGRKLKSLKRYLRTSHNMTPDEYRAYWGLPSDYPMTAPSYAEKRSQLAKEIGLGHSRAAKAAAAAQEAAAAVVAPKTSKKAKAKVETEVPAPEASEAGQATEA